MPAPVCHKVIGSALYATIAATLTKIPGLENININPGEIGSFENADIESDYAAPVSSGLRGEGSFTAEKIWDPLGAVDQFLHTTYNDGGTEIVGKVKIGASGVELTCKYFITKWEIKGEKGQGFKVSIEGKFTEAIQLNETDPA